MPFIYHKVPKHMHGEILFPLSELKKRLPLIHEREIKKYDDHPQRRELPLRSLRKIDCRQEDVLHFCPIHPNLIFKGLKYIFPDFQDPSSFFEIPIEQIRGLPSVYFDMNKSSNYVFGDGDYEDMFTLIGPENYQILNCLPNEALEFYKQWKAQGKSSAPAMGRIPHVMVRGSVSILNCRVINWQCPHV